LWFPTLLGSVRDSLLLLTRVEAVVPYLLVCQPFDPHAQEQLLPFPTTMDQFLVIQYTFCLDLAVCCAFRGWHLVLERTVNTTLAVALDIE
jgi:hypothetical protein